MEVFNKKALTAEEQISLLQQRGLVISNKKEAVNIIRRIGYYHLSSYMRCFQSDKNHNFIKNTTFEQIIGLYNFDSTLRQITFQAISNIEVAYRASISNIMCKEFDSHWFYDSTAFINKQMVDEQGIIITQQEQVLDIIRNEIKKKKKKQNEYAETFIGKYYEKYSKPALPPFWMIAETLTLGSLHKIYYSLSDSYKKQIVSDLGFDKDSTFIALYSNWLQPICMVRNICAHHSRLFNRIFKIKAKQHKKIREFSNISNNSYYYIAMIINYYLKTISNDTSFENNIIKLLTNYPDVNKKLLGFPNNWSHFTITRIHNNKRSQNPKNFCEGLKLV